MNYVWSVWKRCRLVGYVKAYSEREALNRAKERFGSEFFVERNPDLPVMQYVGDNCSAGQKVYGDNE